MNSRLTSRKKAMAGFVIAVLGAVFAALDLHGWHIYAMLSVTAIVAMVAGISLTRKLREPGSASASDTDSLKSRGS